MLRFWEVSKSQRSILYMVTFVIALFQFNQFVLLHLKKIFFQHLYLDTYQKEVKSYSFYILLN